MCVDYPLDMHTDVFCCSVFSVLPSTCTLMCFHHMFFSLLSAPGWRCFSLILALNVFWFADSCTDSGIVEHYILLSLLHFVKLIAIQCEVQFLYTVLSYHDSYYHTL